ncbi:hypothetical protein DFQ28_003102 [Apophysomyces sp. BC1034]|nr:hypothetical protein DFQ28_003102 [Apophysomyces sp. BC1034]
MISAKCTQKKEHLIEIHLSDPTDPSRMPCLYGDAELQRLLHGQEAWLEQRLKQCDDVELFLIELKDLMEKSPTATGSVSAERYRLLVAEFDAIGFDKIQHMSESMDRVSFELNVLNRAHTIHAYFPPTYPLSLPQLSVDIPCGVSIEAATSLQGMLVEYRRLLTQYHDFFECMDEIDTHMRVLEPDNPTRRDTWRRIALGDHCSVQIDIEPVTPNDIPKLRFFGSEKKTSVLWKIWSDYLDHW